MRPNYRDIFGAENFFLELHDHGIEAQQKCNRVLPELAQEFGLGLVAANDVHFLERSHHEAHDVMICIGTGKMVHDEKRMRYVPELYFKSPEEMRELFRDHPGGDHEHARDRRALRSQVGVREFEISRIPLRRRARRARRYLRELCEAGPAQTLRRARPDDPELIARLDYELGVLENTGSSATS